MSDVIVTDKKQFKIVFGAGYDYLRVEPTGEVLQSGKPKKQFVFGPEARAALESYNAGTLLVNIDRVFKAEEVWIYHVR